MSGQYSSMSLLALSAAIAFVNAFAGLSLAQRVRIGGAARTWPWLVGGGVGIGTGVWAQHFLHLLAVQLPRDIGFDPLHIVVSYVVSVLLSIYAMRTMAEEMRSPIALVPNGVVIGAGLFSMHLLSIAAMPVTPPVQYDVTLLLMSLGLAAFTGWVFLFAAFKIGLNDTWRENVHKLSAALGVAVVVMGVHSLGIAAAEFAPETVSELGFGGSGGWLGALVTIICAITLVYVLVAVKLDRRAHKATSETQQSIRAANSELERHMAASNESHARQEARMRATLESALDCIITTDGAGVVTEFNPAAEKTFGYSHDEAIGRSIVELIVPVYRRPSMQAFIRDRNSLPLQMMFGERKEENLQRSDGSAFPAEFSIAEVELGDERFFTLFLRDITSRRAAEDALKSAKEAAEASSNAKTTFLATMSHEIRTPMNALLGLLELHSFTRLDDVQRESVRLMRQSSKSLLRLIDDILDFSKIEAGKLEIGCEPTQLRDVVADVCATFAAIAREKGLVLENRTADTLPRVVMADPLRVRQILGNLVSNAIKFTERGEISVWCAPAFDSPDSNVIEFEVVDSGIGMTDEVMRHCGEPFQQADAGMARRYGGSGLGLAICRRLAELMDGTLEIASQPGVGTRIKVRLPLNTVEASEYRPDITQGLVLSMPSQAPSVEEAAANKQLILVVDDHPTNRRLLVQQLEWLGYACEEFSNGRSALTSYQERARSGSPYAMVITDCQMPEMDGYELAREIRRLEGDSADKIALVAFTANTMRSVTELCHSCGFNDLITKPANLATLKAKLDRWLPLAQSTPLPVGAPLAVHTSALADPQVQEEFRVAHEEDLAMLREGHATANADLVARAAHRIKGAARMIGARQLDEASTSLLRVARTEDWRQIRELTLRVNEITLGLFSEFQDTSIHLRQAS